jgi:hypothetical protein
VDTPGVDTPGAARPTEAHTSSAAAPGSLALILFADIVAPMITERAGYMPAFLAMVRPIPDQSMSSPSTAIVCSK